MGGALYHGPEVAPEEFPEQEEEPGGEVLFANNDKYEITQIMNNK